MPPTRETFGNVPYWSQLTFYILIVATFAIFAAGVFSHLRLWRVGSSKSIPELINERIRARGFRRQNALRRLLADGLGQQRVLRQRKRGLAHAAMFIGFMVLFAGTVLLEIDHLGELISKELKFHRGSYYLIYEFTLDILGLVFIGGCLYFALRRFICKPAPGHRGSDLWVISTLLAIGTSGYFVEALRIVWQQPTGAGSTCSPIGYWLSSVLFSSLSLDAAKVAHLWIWWIHALLVFFFFSAIPFTRLFHFLAGPINIFLSDTPLGTMSTVSLEEFEKSGQLGVKTVSDFSQVSILGADACVECNRCEEACPAFATGKPLSPRKLLQDLRVAAEESRNQQHRERNRVSLVEAYVNPESLWACTTCSACVYVCPLRIDPLSMILEMRRNLVSEGGLSGSGAGALRKLQASSNPWGLPSSQRADWRQMLN